MVRKKKTPHPLTIVQQRPNLCHRNWLAHSASMQPIWLFHRDYVWVQGWISQVVSEHVGLV